MHLKTAVTGALLSLLASTWSFHATAISNSGMIPIINYHTWDHGDCLYANNSLVALEQDLETIFNRGATIVPVYWIAMWLNGDMDGSALPEKPVGLTFDDGPQEDWTTGDPSCGMPSAYQIMVNFKNRHPSLPALSPHASVFVIASPVARAAIDAAPAPAVNHNLSNDSWWFAAQNSGFMEIYNHSVDHDHNTIHGPLWDGDLYAYLAVGGDIYNGGDGNMNGTQNFDRINNHDLNYIEIVHSATYIYNKIGVWPDLFAYPYGHASDYTKQTFFPNYASEHQTYAAFCEYDTYVARGHSGRWCIPRFSHRSAGNPLGSPPGWSTPEEFLQILDGTRKLNDVF